ncbi:MAG: hypothetical protein P8N43_06350, partial [Alphaproteobacteria bacterium]|nr:hypothetical protein [Alphaproteobacteria bacterium]
MIFSAAGNVDHDALVASVDAEFGGLGRKQPAAVQASRYAGGEYREERELEQHTAHAVAKEAAMEA